MNPCPICDYREICPAANKEDWECPTGWNPIGDDEPIQDPDPDNELPF